LGSVDPITLELGDEQAPGTQHVGQRLADA